MSPKFRKYLILAHLWLAGLMAPAFALHAISGGFYLMDIKGTTSKEALVLPAGSALDFGSDTLEAEVRSLLDRANIDQDFEYIRNRGTVIQLRPTSRDFIEFEQTQTGMTAVLVKPDFIYAMMELHKGHGPQLFKTYQKLVALMLLLVVFGGISVGLLAKAYRRQTTTAVVVGTLAFLFVAFVL